MLFLKYISFFHIGCSTLHAESMQRYLYINVNMRDVLMFYQFLRIGAFVRYNQHKNKLRIQRALCFFLSTTRFPEMNK